MKKPVYIYPNFVKKIELNKTDNKRFWLKLLIDESKTESIIVVLKNPSRADEMVSDKTVYNVLNYIYRNRNKYDVFSNVKSIIILNLIPHYQTYSKELKSLKSEIVCQDNLDAIKKVTSQHSKTIIAWGNHAVGLYQEYEILKEQVMQILTDNNNQVYYVDKFSKAQNPKHGQIWGYKDLLIALNTNSYSPTNMSSK